MTAEPEVVVESSAQTLAENTAGRVVAALNAALRDRGVAHLVITGGGILESVLAELAGPPERDAVDWERVHAWWGDERWVAPDSDDRNDRAAFAKLFDHVRIPAGNVHPMPADDGHTSVEAAADAYAADLERFAGADSRAGVPAFDVVLLGVGPDGHCASLFPEHPGTYVDDAAIIAVHNSPKPPPIRLSMTFRTLDAANEIYFVASGDGKAKAVAMAFSGAGRVQVPAAGPRGRHRTLWLIDRDAAAQLPPSVTRLPVS